MSTINGNIKQITGVWANIAVIFRSVATAVLAGSNGIVPGQHVARTNQVGHFEQTLEMGDYEMLVTDPATGKTARFVISVPNDTNTYDFSARVVSAAVYAPTAPPGQGVPNASGTQLGVVKTDVTQTTPVVPTLATLQSSNQRLIEMTLAGAYEIASPTLDALGNVTAGTVKWAGDGSSGVYSAVIHPTWGCVDSFTITHAASGKTVTRAASTRNSSGFETSIPAITVS